MIHVNILIIGAGQLGSRHLQSCLQLENASGIYVVDPSERSIEIARERAQEIGESGHEVHYFLGFEDIALSAFDILIIATGAGPRYSVLCTALDKFRFRYAILEKVLFQELSHYSLAQSLLAKHNVQTYVNCPLRAYPFFKELKNKYAKGCDKPIEIKYTGGEWIGLACNSIHYLDLLQYLTSENLLDIDTSGLDKSISSSKRPGYIEFTGSINCTFSQGSSVYIESMKGSDKKSSIEIAFAQAKIIIDELSGEYDVYVGGECIESSHYEVVYQSNLTHRVINELVLEEDCSLTSYHTSRQLHEIFVARLIEFSNQLQEANSCTLNIT